jgi:hypothetical protein
MPDLTETTAPRRETDDNVVIWIAFFAVYVGLMATELYHDLLQGGLFRWTRNDWLINYSGGMVRRGLSGELISAIASSLDVSPATVVVVVAYALQLAVAVVFLLALKHLRAMTTNGRPVALLLFVPGLLLFPLLDPGAWGRKESLFLLFLALHLRLISAMRDAGPPADGGDGMPSAEALRRYERNAFVVLNLAGLPIMLMHESMLFLSLPLNLILTYTCISARRPPATSALRSFLVHVPTLTAAALCFTLYRGDVAQARVICASLEAAGLVRCGDPLPPALVSLGWANSSLLSTAYGQVARLGGWNLPLWALVLSANGALVIGATRRILSAPAQRIEGPSSATTLWAPALFWKYFALPFLATLPLFAIATDWGRFFHITLMSYVLCTATFELLEIEAWRTADKVAGTGEQTTRRGLPAVAAGAPPAPLPLRWPTILGIAYVTAFTTLPHAGIHPSALYSGLAARLALVADAVLTKIGSVL